MLLSRSGSSRAILLDADLADGGRRAGDAVVHFVAVVSPNDNSLLIPCLFILDWWVPPCWPCHVRFHYISTDEVYEASETIRNYADTPSTTPLLASLLPLTGRSGPVGVVFLRRGNDLEPSKQIMVLYQHIIESSALHDHELPARRPCRGDGLHRATDSRATTTRRVGIPFSGRIVKPF